MYLPGAVFSLYTVIFVIPFYFGGVISNHFDLENVQELNLVTENVTSGYFGYSLLLQSGSKSRLIVGAPKDIAREGGSVYNCLLESGKCEKYNFGGKREDFLGVAIDGADRTGEPFIACAPRHVEITEIVRGFCYFNRNSSDTDRATTIFNPARYEGQLTAHARNGQPYYSYKLAQVGMDVCYNGGENSVLLGAPGTNDWRGAVFQQSLYDYKNHEKIPSYINFDIQNSLSYMGYKVVTGRLEKTRKQLSYIIGAPRGNQMKGMVHVYNGKTGRILGTEIGSYYGASLLAVDIDGDNVDEILVGAPLSGGTSYDEGAVYVHGKGYSLIRKLTNPGKNGGRFGSSITSLGDIDLDKYNDIAISAPYEDDGAGAVYIFKGSKTGIEVPSQRLTPQLFHGSVNGIKSFGQGLSRGNDIDGNGHNDIAIGAYKNSKVFIFRTLSVIDNQMYVNANVSSIRPHVNAIPISINYCIYYTQRSIKSVINSLIFNVRLHLDYRTRGKVKFEEYWNVSLAETKCRQLEIEISESVDVRPFKVSMEIMAEGKIVANGVNRMDHYIPYSHDCGDDNICRSYITATVVANKHSIILGKDRDFEIYLRANNTGEPGYGCQLYLNIPEELDYLAKENCITEHDNIICPFISIFKRNSVKEVHLKFYIVPIIIEAEQLKMQFEVKCLTESVVKNVSEVKLDVITQNSPYIGAKATPSKIYQKTEDVPGYADLMFTFTIGNYGPSPVKSQTTILVPTLKVEGKNVFEFVEAQGNINSQKFNCTAIETAKEQLDGDFSDLIEKDDANKTVTLTCMNETIKCLEIICRGDYLSTSSEVARYTVKMKANLELLGSYIHEAYEGNNMVSYVVSGIFYNTTTRLEKNSATSIYLSMEMKVPIWIIILACIFSVALLLLLTYLLYRFHFFERIYKEKLEGEKFLTDVQRGDETATGSIEMEVDPSNT